MTWSLHADFTLGTLDRLLTVDNILFGFVRMAQYEPYQKPLCPMMVFNGVGPMMIATLDGILLQSAKRT
jgi:hypothetical protein